NCSPPIARACSTMRAMICQESPRTEGRQAFTRAAPETEAFATSSREPTPMFVQLTKEFMGRKAGERIDVQDADAQMLLAQQIAQPVSEDLITPAVQRAMEQAFGGFQK